MFYVYMYCYRLSSCRLGVRGPASHGSGSGQGGWAEGTQEGGPARLGRGRQVQGLRKETTRHDEREDGGAGSAAAQL